MGETSKPSTSNAEAVPRRDSAAAALLARVRYLGHGTPSKDGRVVFRDDASRSEELYRDRWRHDKEVRTTHGVNCTGSCSWKVFVRDGIIVWEAQQTDYPDDLSRYARPRAARLPAGRDLLLVYLRARAREATPTCAGRCSRCGARRAAVHDDPVDAWQSIATDPEKSRAYKSARGHGGFLRATLGRGARALRRRPRLTRSRPTAPTAWPP